MAPKFLAHLPGLRWIPHDIPTRAAPKRSRNPFSSASRSGPDRVHSTADLSAHDTRTLAQDQSVFFARLPAELRQMVYEYVMGRATVHLTMGSKKRFGHFVCDSEEEMGCKCRVLVGGKEGARLDAGCIALLRTCRRMYFEAHPHLYIPHTFSLLHPTHLLFLPSHLKQTHLIRTLHIRWAIRALPYLRRGPANRLAYREDTANWERGWSIVAGMAGLRELFVVVVDPSPNRVWERHWKELEEELLAPVKQVTGPRRFEMVLPYGRWDVRADMGASRVVFRRAGEEVENG